MKDEHIEKAAEETIEDLKVIFRFQTQNKNTKIKTLYIPENKLGILRYLLIKNLKRQNNE